MGPTILQGPHHAAQKSTMTGLSAFNTSSSKFVSVISKAISIYFIQPKLIILENVGSSDRIKFTYLIIFKFYG
jgi:hypothetical protein